MSRVSKVRCLSGSSAIAQSIDVSHHQSQMSQNSVVFKSIASQLAAPITDRVQVKGKTKMN